MRHPRTGLRPGALRPLPGRVPRRLYAVPHRQFVFTVPKRLRPFFLHDRKLLGVLARLAYRTLRDFMRTTLREPDVVPGVVASIQTFGTVLNWHPHLHFLVTDGAFRLDGTLLHLDFHDIEVLTEAFRRAVLREFVRRELLDPGVAQSMLAWEHSGFHVHHSVRLDPRPLRRRLLRPPARSLAQARHPR
jgi:hypothetical protein